MQFLPYVPRLRCAALMAITGGAVAQSMSLWGGDLARFLPPLWAMSCAGAAGAGMAGLVSADAFGRRGRTGAIWSLLGWPLASLLGAVIGAVLVAIATTGERAVMIMQIVTHSAPLGVLAVADGIATSSVVAAVWMVSGLAMHYGARVERGIPT